MNILFLTLAGFNSIYDHGIYPDLMREFSRKGHYVCIISPSETREGVSTHIIEEDNARILRLKIGNTQKTGIIRKGISTVMIEPAFKRAIQQYFSDISFDLIIYSTPPITLVSAVEYVKRRDGAKTFLLLKDIFPQNAVDLGLMSVTGIKGLLYSHFRKQEKRLYAVSDRIGCMSPANVEYVLLNNPEIDPAKVCVCPNSIEVINNSIDDDTRETIREKYGIPTDKEVFVYGGNLGKPQDIPFVIECMKSCVDISEAFFLIVGDGTEYGLLENYVNRSKQQNMQLMHHLPKEEFDLLVAACDIGLLFLDHRFTIPNFPSRMLSYMQAKLPILAVTDPNTDIGRIIVEGGFGWWCESSDSYIFAELVRSICLGNSPVLNPLINKNENLGNISFNYLCDNYSVEKSYNTIINNI